MPLPGRGPGPRGLPPRRRRVIPRAASSGGMDPSTMKYLIYFLTFVVGNAILFFSTAYVIIPR